ncbi:MAG: hypothetical protein JNM17_21725 [Archangium sp.]|nr:hypothetical protein [Archangium sp.]
MLQPLLVTALSLSSGATTAHVSLLTGAHVSDATGVSALLAATFEVATPLDGEDEFYRLEFRAAASGLSTPTGAALESLISARVAFAYASVGLVAQLRPVTGLLRTDLVMAAGPSVGVRLLERDHMQLRIAVHWMPFGTTFNAARTVAEVWGGWKALGFLVSGSPFVSETTPRGTAYFSAAVAVRFET